MAKKINKRDDLDDLLIAIRDQQGKNPRKNMVAEAAAQKNERNLLFGLFVALALCIGIVIGAM